ncbi:MAG: NAD(+) synthase, partial [Candidatus Woesearchaeota archaeon]
MKRILLPFMQPRIVADEIGDFIVNSVVSMSGTGGVIGLSGGVDSTMTAALAKRAFNGKNLELVGYILPSKINTSQDTLDGIAVADTLGIRYEHVNIESVVESYRTTNPEVFSSDCDKGNLISRIRANILSTKAAKENKIVVGTGNKDEDFGIGYYTLFGDGAVHISPIGNLPKRLVRQMATYLGFDNYSKKEPAAGLEPGQTDFLDLGYNYDAVELVLEGISQGFSAQQLIGHLQLEQMILPQLNNNPKFSSLAGVVHDILRRHYEIALPKQEIIHPSIPQVTLSYR